MRSSIIFVRTAALARGLALAAAVAAPALLGGCATYYEVGDQIRAGQVTAWQLRAISGKGTPKLQRPCLLYGAILIGDVQVARDLMSDGMEANDTSGTCMDKTREPSLLRRAILTENVEMVAALLQHMTRDQGSGLLLAAQLRNAELVRLLLRAGADPMATNHIGETALDVLDSPRAAGLGRSPAELQKILVDAGVRRADPATVRENARKHEAFLVEQRAREEEFYRSYDEERRKRRRAEEREAEDKAQAAREAENERREASRRAYQRNLGKRAAEAPDQKPAAPAVDIHLTVEAKSPSPPPSPPPKKYETPQPTPRPPSPPRVIKPCVKDPRNPKAACTIDQ